MKKSTIIILLASIILLTFSCNSGNHQEKEISKKEKIYTINGNLKGFPDSTTIYFDKANGTPLDSTIVKNGKFQFVGEFEKPSSSYIYSHYLKGTKINLSVFFWIEEGEITITANTANIKDTKATGIKLNLIANKLKLKTESLYTRRSELTNLFHENPKKNNYIWNEVRSIDSATSAITYEFIKEQPNNMVSMMWLFEQSYSYTNDSIKAILEKLNSEMRKTQEYLSLQNLIKFNKIRKGDSYREVSGKNLEGKEVKLSEILKGKKVVLLDFWSSGCRPCRMQNIQLEKNYKKYHKEGFEIVGFSLDKNKKNWEKASVDDSISWVNISDFKAYHSPNVLRYKVYSIPNGFLINEDGKIINKYGGYSPEKDKLAADLEKIFGF